MSNRSSFGHRHRCTRSAPTRFGHSPNFFFKPPPAPLSPSIGRQGDLKKKFREWPTRVGADRVHRWRCPHEHRLLTGRSKPHHTTRFPPFPAISALRRRGRSTGVTGDVTDAAAGTEARAVPAATQSSHRGRLDAWDEHLRAGQNKYEIDRAQSLHMDAFWRPSVKF